MIDAHTTVCFSQMKSTSTPKRSDYKIDRFLDGKHCLFKIEGKCEFVIEYDKLTSRSLA